MKTDLSKATAESLLDLYVRLSAEQSQAHYVCNAARYNRIGDTLYEITNEMKRRPEDRGASLLKLFGHPNSQVRFNAATSVSGLYTQEARQVLQLIAASETDLLSFDAKMYLRTLDDWIRTQGKI